MRNTKTLRVQSGYLKGKTLLSPDTLGTRPTKSIVKECVFNLLRYELAEAEFIEAFGGSASMAIEAISNGAIKAYVCEKSHQALAVVRKNCAGLNIEVHSGDAFDLIEGLIAQIKANFNKAIVYLDPPFSIREGFAGIYERLSNTCKGADLIIIEHESSAQVSMQGFKHITTRKFGKTSISVFA